jgi:hypothetical protein
MNVIITLCACLLLNVASAQELYVATEPASNMPAKSIGLRLNNYYSAPASVNRTTTGGMYRLNPEIMWGVNKNLMLHLNGYASNMHHTNFVVDGVSAYAKFRFLSIDNVQRHFRLATYAKGALINKDIQYQEINLNGDNSGVGAGLVATQLLHKLALSFTGGYTNTFNTASAVVPQYGLNYSLSFGYLLLPFKYNNFNQTNVNLYAEFLGKKNPENNTQFVDALTAIQFIIKSKMRIDLGYRRQLAGNMYRINRREFMLRLEYNIFNAYK